MKKEGSTWEYKPLDKRHVRSWKVLQNGVMTYNDDEAYQLEMLTKTFEKAKEELGKLQSKFLRDGEYKFVDPAISTMRDECELGDADSITVKNLLQRMERMKEEERVKYETINVRWMGRLDPRVQTDNSCRTHSVPMLSVLEHLEINPLEGLTAKDFNPPADETGQNRASSSDDRQWRILQEWRTALWPAITDCPFLLNGGRSWVFGLVWCIFGRIRFRKWCKSCGIELMRDWHSYTRQIFNVRYHEEVEDKRGFYDLMETSLELQRFCKDLRVICSDEAKNEKRDEITDEGGDSDQLSYYQCSEVEADPKLPNSKSKMKSAKVPGKEPVGRLSNRRVSQVLRSHDDDEYQDGAENGRLGVAKKVKAPLRKRKADGTSAQPQTESSYPVKKSKPSPTKGSAGAVVRAPASKAAALAKRTELNDLEKYTEGVMRYVTE
jgi:hypothetical protein